MKRLMQRPRNIVDFKKQARRVLKASINSVKQRWDSRKYSATAIHIYEIRPRADKHGFVLSSYGLPNSSLWYRGPHAIEDAIRHAKFCSQSHPVVIQVYDEAGNVIETQQHFLKP
jgi:hypothetical protein